MSKNSSQNIDYYLSLNYEIVLRKMTRSEAGIDDPPYLAKIPSVNGLMAEGKTPEEALQNLEDVKRIAFELMLKQGKSIPEPDYEELTHVAA